MAARKQMTEAQLQIAQFRDRTLRTAFLCAAGALTKRPRDLTGGALFDAVGAADHRSTPWRQIQDAMRAAARAAADDGRPLVISETEARITAFYAALKADALAPLPLTDEERCAVQAALEETRREGIANNSEARWLARPTCRQRLARVIEDCRSHIQALKSFVRAGERQLLGEDAHHRSARVAR